MSRTRLGRTDRAVSISVSHVLTIAITTVLISMLLVGASSVLEAETDRAAEASLETIGERLAGEIDAADRLAAEAGTETVVLATDHPRTVAQTGYVVSLRQSCDAPLLDGDTDCLRLSATDVDVVVFVPLPNGIAFEEHTVSGGAIEIVDGDDGIELRGETP